MKALLALAPICLAAMIYALTQGDWKSVGLLVFIEVLIFVLHRAERRSRSPRESEHRNES
jgi:hypothetical protein